MNSEHDNSHVLVFRGKIFIRADDIAQKHLGLSPVSVKNKGSKRKDIRLTSSVRTNQLLNGFSTNFNKF